VKQVAGRTILAGTNRPPAYPFKGAYARKAVPSITWWKYQPSKKFEEQPVIRIGQRYLMKTPSGKSYGDYLGETVELSATDDGGTAVYRGLIDAPIVINVGKREYEFDAAETEVRIRLGDALDQNRY
jgi:hypothetical protein